MICEFFNIGFYLFYTIDFVLIKIKFVYFLRQMVTFVIDLFRLFFFPTVFVQTQQYY